MTITDAPNTIPDEAIAFIFAEEDSSEAYYSRHYLHWDWPEGASGPTIGVGYDCGYVATGEARVDWDGIVDDATIDNIVKACGLRGEAAHQFVRANAGSVTITYDQAMREFKEREIPKWVKRVRAALPNTDKLPPLCLGAVVSLAYNRGCSFDLPGARYGEMRAIKAHMAALNFQAIPADILSMQRLWPRGGDLWNRRAHEAALFQKGLTAKVTS
jgi:GH24 family phage-related lysozyme (muramidase)